MKTKHFYLCLLLLVLGVANVWADKYYKVSRDKIGAKNRYNSLQELVNSGAKFMIYNTAIRLVPVPYEYNAPEGVNFEPAPIDGTSDRRINNIKVNGTDISVSDGTRFQDKTATQYAIVKPGHDVQVTVTAGTWMHAYLYLDKDNDGFSVTVENEKKKITGDICSYSFYSFGGADTEGWNDKGEVLTGGNRATMALSSFTAPNVPGKYRMRVKLDWNNVDPMVNGIGNAMVVDFILFVTDEEKQYKDNTGFLYHTGTSFGYTKSKEQDIDIFNDCHLFTLEASGTENEYFLKSVSTDAYVDFDGKPKSQGSPIVIYPWSKALGDTKYNNDGSLNTTGDIKEDPEIYSELSNYTIMQGYSMTDADRAFIVKYKDGDWYWNCSDDGNAFKTEQQGDPYAFYVVNEVWPNDYANVEDLHIYSRCDIYSAQKIYGYAQDRSKYSCNYPCVDGYGNVHDGSGYPALIDGDQSTYFHSGYDGYNPGPEDEPHYLQVDLGDGVSTDAFHIYYKRRLDNNYNRPTVIEVSGSTDATAWTSITTLSGLPSDEQILEYYSNEINTGGAKYRYLRFTVTATNYGSRFFTFSEFYVLPHNTVIEDAMDYFDNTLPVNATAAEYDLSLLRYNNEAAEVKLLSGVPLPGNKYRIYADAYHNGAWANRDIYTNDNGDLLANGTFAKDNDYYVWECILLADGSLAFKNEKTGKYLANGTTVTDAYGWKFYTNETFRHGVPLCSEHKYLAAYNDGNDWDTDVNMAQQQTLGVKLYKETTTDAEGNSKTEIKSDDTKSLCSDFVFLPVDRKANEKKVTILGVPLAARNSAISFGGVNTYKIPYSCIVKDTDNDNVADMPVLTATASAFHRFVGFYDSNGTNIGTTLEYNEVADGAYVTAQFEILQTPEMFTQAAPSLYAIKNVRNGRYAIFAGENNNLQWGDNLCVEAMFYFTDGEFNDQSHFSAFIEGVLTTKKMFSATEWTKAGNIYYLQPNSVDDMAGFAITRTKLDKNNNPQGLCGNDDTEKCVLSYGVEDKGALWVFEKIDDPFTMIKNYIAAKKDEIHNTLDTHTGEKYSAGKVQAYKDATAALNTNAQGITEKSQLDELIGIAHQMYTYGNEIKYATIALPLLSECQENPKTDPYDPNWYYVRNVASPNHIAQYVGDNVRMALYDSNNSKQLNNLFYIAGDVMNPDAIGEYFVGHVHNFSAYTREGDTYDETVVDRTLVSGNDKLFNDAVVGEGFVNQKVPGFQPLKADKAWQISIEGGSNGSTYNHWGSGLLASGSNALADDYSGGFQFYLQADGDIVVKLNRYDTFVFEHTRGAYSYFKIVMVYNGSDYVTIDVTNANGRTERREKNLKELGITLGDINELCTALPAGVNVTSITGETIKAMTWNKEHGENTWYVLPSSNTVNPGHAIVVKSPDPENLGWTNVELTEGDVKVRNKEIYTYLGTDNYSTWEFVKVVDFKEHMDQMLELWSIDDCTVYYKKLVDLWDNMKKIYAQCQEEYDGGNTLAFDQNAFNDMVELVRKYNGADKSEYLLPKKGRMYTIRHTYDGAVKSLAVDEHNKVVMRNVYGDVLTGAPEDGKTYYIYANTYNKDDSKFVNRYFYYNDKDGKLTMDTDRGEDVYKWVCSYDDNTKKYSFRNVGDDTKWLAHREVSGTEHFFTIGKLPAKYEGTTLWTDNVDENGGRYLVMANSGETFDQAKRTFDQKDSEWCTDVVFVPCDDYEYDSRGVWMFEDDLAANTDPLANGLVPGLTYNIYADAANGNDFYLCDYDNGLVATTILQDDKTYKWLCIDNGDGTFSFKNLNGKYLSATAEGNLALGDTPAKYDVEKAGALYRVTDVEANNRYMVVKNDGLEFNRDKNKRNDDYCSYFVFVQCETDELLGDFVMKNLHTQSYVTTFGADSTSLSKNQDISWIVNDDDTPASPITLERLVASKVNVKVADDYMMSNPDESLVVNGADAVDNTEGVNKYKWYIEEIDNPEKVRHIVTIPSHGHNALVLGFDAKVPEGMHAYWPRSTGDILTDRYVSMTSFTNGIIPANEPVLLKVDGITSDPSGAFAGIGESKEYKFYYSKAASTEEMPNKLENVLYGSLYNEVLDCADFDEKNGDSNIYMFQMSKNLPKLYWIYEEYNSNGELSNPNSDGGRHIVIKANRVFFALSKEDVKNYGSLSLRYDMGVVTGIEDVVEVERGSKVTEAAMEGIFDLQGRRLHQITSPGIYIVDGEKVVVK